MKKSPTVICVWFDSDGESLRSGDSSSDDESYSEKSIDSEGVSSKSHRPISSFEQGGIWHIVPS